MKLYVAGETITAGATVEESLIDGKAYARQQGRRGTYLGAAGELLREGFRVCVRPDGDVFEDDA